jgi:probable rRNA maturation factor
MKRIAITDHQKVLTLDRGTLRRVARQVLDGEGVARAEVGLAFVDDAAIHVLNRRYLQHDEPTDVITFPLSEPGEGKLSGEIVVSTETARRVARQLGHPDRDELLLYVVHGLLHLCGFDDRAPRDRREMRRREAHYLKQAGVQLKGPVEPGPRRRRRRR